MNIKNLDARIKHLQHLQKVTSDPASRRRITQDLVQAIAAFNRERKTLNEREDRGDMHDRNLELAREAFAKVGRGKVITKNYV